MRVLEWKISIILALIISSTPVFAAENTNTRLKRLETKTDYFNKKVIIKKVKYQKKSKSTGPEKSETCKSQILFKLAGPFNKPAELKIWLDTNIAYDFQSTNGQYDSFLATGRIKGSMLIPKEQDCRYFENKMASGNLAHKDYCSLDVAAGQSLYYYAFGYGGQSNDDCIGEYINTVDVKIKVNQIEMIEPQ